MFRILYFLMLVFAPVFFGWWLFFGMAILVVYLAKLPYEIIVAGAILDSFYYFGEGFIAGHQLTIFSTLLILSAMFLNDRLLWSKAI